MFEVSLSESLKKIFDLPKATYDLQGESQEHDCIFINVQAAKNGVKDGKFVSKVMGKITVFCNADELPYGYFSKKIDQADKSLVGRFFFHDIEENAPIQGRVSERTLSFVYLFDSQYNPVPNITELITVGT